MDLDCKVHRGFYYAFLDVQKQILSSAAAYKSKYPGSDFVLFSNYSASQVIV